MSYVMVDVESDGPIPGDFSMICIGAVIVEAALSRTFYGKLRPISERWVPEALAISGFSREDTVAFDNPCDVMACFERWIKENTNGRPIMISDNAGYDWQFVNWYFHHFLGRNPLGYSASRYTQRQMHDQPLLRRKYSLTFNNFHQVLVNFME